MSMRALACIALEVLLAGCSVSRSNGCDVYVVCVLASCPVPPTPSSPSSSPGECVVRVACVASKCFPLPKELAK